MNDAKNKSISVVGAGIAGLTCAYLLSRTNHTIALYDHAGFPSHSAASYIAGGMLAPYSEIDLLTPEWLDTAKQSITDWQDILSALNKDVFFAQTGTLMIAHTEDAYMLERFKNHLPGNDEWKALNASEVAEKAPPLQGRFKQALFLPSEGALHPQQTMEALCKALNDAPNVSMHHQNAAPTELARQHDIVIDCRGMGTQDQDPSLRGVKGEIAIVRNPDITLNHTLRLMHPRYPLYIVPRPDNIFMIGATQIESSHNAVTLRSAMELLSALYSLHPSFGDAEILDLKSGIRPAYPDNLPRISRNDNIIAINGLFRHGYLLAPAIAKTVADMIENTSTQSIFLKDAA
jgi:glycine oxidase